MLRSQKAKGVDWLLRHSTYYSPFFLPPADYYYEPGLSEELAAKAVRFLPIHDPHLPAFVRPCPMKPRHGFVESRMVTSVRQLIAVTRAAFLADPDAEFILMPQLSGRFSAVATNAGVTWGAGNSGVTGLGLTYHIPVGSTADVWMAWLPQGERKSIGIKNNLFIELVEDAGKMRAVQLRDGPELPTVRNYIPCRWHISDVLSPPGADYPLLEWEADVKRLAKKVETLEDGSKRGAVIWLPNGNLASHFAVHGVGLEIPVLCDELPLIGTTLEPEAAGNKQLGAVDLEYLRGDLAGSFCWRFHLSGEGALDHANGACTTAVAALHACAAWGNEPHLLRLRAFSAAIIARMTIAAALGEDRHFYRAGPGKNWGGHPVWQPVEPDLDNTDSERPSCVPWTEIMPAERVAGYFHPKGVQVTREEVYAHTLNLPLHKLVRIVPGLLADMQENGWDGSYGGHNWRHAVECAGKLLDACAAFIRKATPARWSAVLAETNNTVNCVHNGGRVLSKWINGGALNTLAIHPQLGLCNPVTWSVVTVPFSNGASEARMIEALLQPKED